MRMPVARNNNRLLPRAIAHARKLPWRIVVRDVARVQDVEALLQIHARAESPVACAGEDGHAQLGFCIVPLPQGAELDCAFYREAIARLWSVDGDLEDVLCGECDERMLDVGMW